jgi:hypothetical protein
MTRRLTQSLGLLLLLAAAVPACGKYGPPSRLPVAAPPSGAAAPAGESCEDEPAPTQAGTP